MGLFNTQFHKIKYGILHEPIRRMKKSKFIMVYIYWTHKLS